MTGKGTPGSSAAPNELVDDRALQSADDDLLRHRDLAAELAEVIGSVKAPASIALWGPWGSGKSGLALLLERALGECRPGARFVKFDAFKFAETPLRRHFISQVAEELEVKDKEFREGLYRDEITTELKIPAGRFWRLLWTFLWVVIVVEIAAVALLVVLAGISSWIGSRSFADAFHDMVGTSLALALAPAGLLAAFTALAGQTLPVKRTQSAPSSDEEFERLFKCLVKKAKADPLVVFIDELDRCSAEEVVSTLEAIRTFLDVPGVIYVVAADQQVLERALRRAARQTTPPDAINPYYSAGSAYLDKIFQFQFQVPPVRTRGLWDFALNLTEGLDGVWKEIDRPQVISVLIPTHVRSPRRVKRLLNAFVLNQRLARRRAEASRVDGPIEERIAEIAKLTCLQIEFPLFAIDLAIEPRLPEYVLRAYREEELPKYLPPEVHQRAKGYAEGRLNVDEIIATDAEEGSAKRAVAEAPPASADEDAVTKAEADEEGLRERSEEKTGSAVAKVGRIHAEQLIRYLQKTRMTRGPGSDLIYMESRGAIFGLDAAVANALSDAAIDGDLDEVKETVRELEDPALQRSALELLAQRGKEASIGVGGRNAISALLTAIAELENLDLIEVADTLADAVATHEESNYSLESEELGGALALATVSSREIGKRLLKLVLNRPEAEETSLGIRIINEAERIPSELRGRVATVVTMRMVAEPKAVVDSLVRLEDGLLGDLLGRLAAALPAMLEAQKAAEEESEATPA